MSDKTDVTMWVESLPVLEQIGGLLEFFYTTTERNTDFIIDEL